MLLAQSGRQGLCPSVLQRLESAEEAGEERGMLMIQVLNLPQRGNLIHAYTSLMSLAPDIESLMLSEVATF